MKQRHIRKNRTSTYRDERQLHLSFANVILIAQFTKTAKMLMHRYSNSVIVFLIHIEFPTRNNCVIHFMTFWRSPRRWSRFFRRSCVHRLRSISNVQGEHKFRFKCFPSCDLVIWKFCSDMHKKVLQRHSETFSAAAILLTFHRNSKMQIIIATATPQTSTKNTPPTLPMPSSGAATTPLLPWSQSVTIRK